MGLLERSRSLRRKPSTITKSGNEEEEARDDTQTTTVVSVTQEFEIRSARLGASYTKELPPKPQITHRPRTATRPNTAKRPTSPNRKAEPVRRPDLAGQTIDFPTGDLVFRFPTPSPRLPSPAPTHHSNDSTIGIALGSPRLQPPQYLDSPVLSLRNHKKLPPTPLRNVTEPLPSSGRVATFPSRSPEKVVRKQKSGGFMAIFGRKRSKPDTDPLANWQPPVPASYWQQSQRSYHEGASSATSGISHPTTNSGHSARAHVRQVSDARGFTRQQKRAELDKAHFDAQVRAQNVPKTPAKDYLPALPDESKAVSGMDRVRQATSALSDIRTNAIKRRPVPAPAIATNNKFLDIPIPKAEMERYSIMFDKCLQRQPSLLERRQGTLKRLKTVGQGLTVETSIQRRATSPHVVQRASPKPSLTVEPDSANKPQPLRIDKPQSSKHLHHLERSNTAPAGSLSPGTAERAQQLPTASSGSPAWNENSLPPTPTSAETHTFLNIGSGAAVTAHGSSKVLSKMEEHGWDIDGPKVRKGRVDSIDPQASYEEGSAQTAQISIARSVSLNRKKGTQKPVVVKQPLRPRLVDTGNRKSTLVVIEHAGA